MSELERKDKVAVLLARALEINAEFGRLTAQRWMISEMIYELQKGDK